MQRIRRLKIGRKLYLVRYRFLFPKIYGQIDLKNGTLELADDLAGVEAAYAVIHETLHGIWFHQAIPERAREERIVTDLAWGLTRVFSDNPGLLQHIEKLVSEAR